MEKCLQRGDQLTPANVFPATCMRRYDDEDAFDMREKKAYLKMFWSFLARGWDVNSKISTGFPALRSVLNDEQLTEWFLKHGADPAKAQKPSGPSVLYVAVVYSTLGVVKLLVPHRAKVNDSEALHSAGLYPEISYLEKVAFPVKKGMDINAIQKCETYGKSHSRDVGRGTPLHCAVGVGAHTRMFPLINLGADTKAKNSRGKTPLELVTALKMPEVITALKEKPMVSSHSCCHLPCRL